MVTVFAPVNIAWIKYMGKNGSMPGNSSLSMTLDQIGTHTVLQRLGGEGPISLDFTKSSYVPPESGQAKILRFLSDCGPFYQLLQDYGFTPVPAKGLIRFQTSNNAPAGTGIATSASGFAALTLAWLQLLSGDRSKEWVSLYQRNSILADRAAKIARLGSGSACRSFHGPFVEWTSENEIVSLSSPHSEFVDYILLLERDPKPVSSSEAHVRVKTSPLYSSRMSATHDRIRLIKDALSNGSLEHLSSLVREEAIEMHELFHTSDPPFRYLNEESLFWLSGSWARDTRFEEAICTADAGANVHIFIRKDLASDFEFFLKKEFPMLSYLVGRAGTGAHYVR